MVVLWSILGYFALALAAMRIFYIFWTKDFALPSDDQDYIPVIIGGLFWPLIGVVALFWVFGKKVLFRETVYEKRRRLAKEARDQRFEAIKTLLRTEPSLVNETDREWYRKGGK